MVTKTILTPTADPQPRTLPGAGRARLSEFADVLSRPWVKTLLFLAGDIGAVLVAHALAETGVRRFLGVPPEYLDPKTYAFFYVPFFAALLYLRDGYKSPDLRRPERELELVFSGISISFVALVCANFVFFKNSAFSRYLLVAWYALALLLLLVTRFGLRAIYDSLWRRGLARQRALLIGTPAHLAAYRNALSIQRYQAYEMVGALLESNGNGAVERAAAGLPVLGAVEDWESVAAQNQVRLIFLSLPETATGAHPRTLEILRRCLQKRLDVEVFSDLFGTSEFTCERDEFSGFFRFTAAPKWSRTIQRLLKTALDQLIGLVGSVVTLLLIPVVALLLKIEDGGPVFYRSEFVGTDGEVHHYLKFRTMVRDADQILKSRPAWRAEFDRNFKLADDPRILRVGGFLRKWSLDEFPQFFSVLAGQLTFVGPRTISREEITRYGALLPKLLSVKPGLTGFWQVQGRQTTSYDERVQMDMFYVDHWSIWLDLVIVFKTIWKVIRAEGAC